ncbi:MAG: NHLP bacteriocin export ABC transporter permease/ATPase subunit, partial [Anaerovibrio sp.]|uniref:NHLP bacteriocin export ABC transporter permease/ATPase subunit n=1 Tax=Anaerovibrio sp. TaxID=1872532 RepID=UPI0025D53BA8
IDIQLYALEDVVLREISLSGESVEKLRPLMQGWFKKMMSLSWLRLLADRGDDVLLGWRRGTVLVDESNREELLESFRDNEEIFSMFLGLRFSSEDKRLSRRMEIKKWSKSRLVENGIRSLLGEEHLFDGVGDINKEESKEIEEAIFIVQQVAKALSMPTDSIEISPENAKQLDSVGVLRRLVQKGNMQMRLVTLPNDWYTKDTGVLIGFFSPPGGKERTLCALIPDTPKSYRIVTKDNVQGVPLTDEVEEFLARDAFMCYAGFPQRVLKLWDLVKFMFKQCWKTDYQTIILCSIFAGIIPLITPIITETIFQDIIPILDRQGLATITQALMVTSFTAAAISIVRSIAIMRISTRIEIAAEAAMWGRLMTLPTQFFRKFTAGELASRMGGIGVAKNLASGSFVESILGFVCSFWSIFLMCYYSLKLTAAAIVVWIVYAGFVALVYRRILFFQRKIIAAGNKTAGTVQQIFAGLAKFRVQGAEEQAYNLWTRDFGEQWNWSLKLRWQNNYTSIISSIQPFVLTLILYWIAVYGMNEVGPDGKTLQTGIGYAQFIAFNAAYTSFNGVMGGVIGLIGEYFAIQPQLENLRPILKEMPENVGEKQDAGKLTGHFEVKHLTFAYQNPQSGEPGAEVLHDVSFSVEAGENVAIVGKSGSGKSTLVRLILGFEQPKSGAIYFDGQDLSELNLPSVRSQLGVVLQNGQLMTGDIYSNIVGTRMLTQDDAWEAAEAAGIAADIADMPMGMQTVISEGSSNISGGQRQRILIARALVGKPVLLLLDEATSALDNRSQAIVAKSLDNLKATRIIVAHRLSTIRNCDRIIVMDNGSIAEVGGFDELVEKGGIFSQLVQRQLA